MQEYYLNLREDLADRISEVLEDLEITGTEASELLEALLPEIVEVVRALNEVELEDLEE